MDSSVFWGSALGVIAGAFIQYGAQLLIHRHYRNRLRNNVLKEIEYNRRVITSASTETDRMKQSIYDRNFNFYIPNYSGLASTMTIQLMEMVRNGQIYEYLDRTDMDLIFKYSRRIDNNANIFIINQTDGLKANLMREDASIDEIYSQANTFCSWLKDEFSTAEEAAVALQDKLQRTRLR